MVVNSWIVNAQSVKGASDCSCDDIMLVEGSPSNRDSVTIKKASLQMLSEVFLAYHGITTAVYADHNHSCSWSLLGKVTRLKERNPTITNEFWALIMTRIAD